MAERDDRRRRASETRGKGGAGQPAGRRRRQSQGGAPAGRQRPAGPSRSHNLKLEVGGHGVELHCDTCDLVVTHLAAPQVRRGVEEAHRSHLGSLSWESGWVAVCSCGWRTGRLNQQVARQELADHEASVLRPAARGETPP